MARKARLPRPPSNETTRFCYKHNGRVSADLGRLVLDVKGKQRWMCDNCSRSARSPVHI